MWDASLDACGVWLGGLTTGPAIKRVYQLIYGESDLGETALKTGTYNGD